MECPTANLNSMASYFEKLVYYAHVLVWIVRGHKAPVDFADTVMKYAFHGLVDVCDPVQILEDRITKSATGVKDMQK